MPSLKVLLDEIRKLGADPDDVRVPGVVYDDLIEQAEESESSEEEE